MKMYKKSKLRYKDGYIVKDGKVIGIDNKIVDLFNELEGDWQRYTHEKFSCPGFSPDEKPFTRKTEHGKVFGHVEPKTPELDATVEKSMKIMDELDAIANAEKCNCYLSKMQPVIQFVNDKRIVDCKQEVQHRFDLPTLGDPLELDAEAVVMIITTMFME